MRMSSTARSFVQAAQIVNYSHTVAVAWLPCRGPVRFCALFGATLPAPPQAAPFDAQLWFAERRHDAGTAGFKFNIDDLIGFRADDRSASTVAAVSADNRRRDHEVEPQSDNRGDE